MCRSQVLAEWKQCVRDGYFRDFDYRMISRSGEILTVLSRGVPVVDAGTRTWVGMHLDVTARERSVDEQVRQARDIARFNAELEQLAYVSAHDLQEPLRIIASYLQLLKRRYGGKPDAEADEFIEYAVEGATRLRVLLQDLLLLQSIGKSGRHWKKFHLSGIVKCAIHRPGGPALEAEIEVGELPEVAFDENEFTQLFEHLIANAVKYSRACVGDNGIGVAPEYRYRVFEVFQRLHSRADYPGTGIGLAICRKIVEVHGGRIWVDSTLGEGSRFCFFVPNGN